MSPFRWFCLLLTLLGCAPPVVHLPDEQRRIVEVTLSSWRKRGLPDPSTCLRGAKIVWAKSRAEFEDRCRVTMHEPGIPGAAACTTDYKYQMGLVVHSAPVAFLAVDQPLFDSTGSVAAHEFFHALQGCALPPDDKYRIDRGHQDVRVWMEAGGAASAQGLQAAELAPKL